MRAVIWREGGFIKNRACLDDLRIMDIVIGGRLLNEIYGAKVMYLYLHTHVIPSL